MAQSMSLDLEAARIQRLPGEAFYIPDFVDEEEEERLLAKVCMLPIGTLTSVLYRDNLIRISIHASLSRPQNPSSAAYGCSNPSPTC